MVGKNTISAFKILPSREGLSCVSLHMNKQTPNAGAVSFISGYGHGMGSTPSTGAIRENRRVAQEAARTFPISYYAETFSPIHTYAFLMLTLIILMKST